tara:strand:+ start:10539 stop:11348 length:810 start_codon:yes stop_codon:yes gene_type:complete
LAIVIDLTLAFCKNGHMHYKQTRQGRTATLINQDVLDTPDALLFEGGPQPASASDSTQGRGTVRFFKHQGLSLVQKKYHRGGFFGRLIKDSYVYTGIESSRMWREFLLLGQMLELGLPVPRPVAARCVRGTLLTYQGDLITERISNSETLADLLCRQALPESTWQALGQTISRFHQQRIDHTDLNAANILLTDSDQIYLIDFDKCAMRPAGDDRWCDANLGRLHRSLLKWQKRDPAFHFEPHCWQALLSGYHQPNSNTPSSSESRLSNF